MDKFSTSKIGTGEGISPYPWEFHVSKEVDSTWHHLAHRMEFEGKQYVVRMSVREDANGQRFYDHEFTDISEESGEEARNAASGFARTEGASSSGLGDGGQRNGTPSGSTTKSREAPLAQDLPKEDTRNVLAEILSASPNHLSKGEVEERLWEMSSTQGTPIESADGSGEKAGMAATDRDSTAADAPASQRGTTGASPAPTSSRTRKKDASNNPSSTTDTC